MNAFRQVCCSQTMPKSTHSTANGEEKGIPLAHHATHLIVHGLLHLAGHDHVHSDAEAEAMEALEIAALAKMGISDPYGDRHSTEEKS